MKGEMVYCTQCGSDPTGGVARTRSRRKANAGAPDARPRRRLPATLMALLLAVLTTGCGTLCLRPLPPGAYVLGQPQPAPEVRFLGDVTYLDASGKRQSDQVIFDDVLALIAAARSIVVADVFLFNEWAGLESHPQRALTSELTAALISKRQVSPECTVLLITDPINSAYGGAHAPHLDRLRAAGVTVVETNLDKLRDSNPIYSLVWRLLVRPFGNSPGGLLPNPFDGGRVTLRTYLRMLNFKANHRKVFVADPEGVPTAVVTSANPHDASSAHSNAGVRFTGEAALDLLWTELAVAEFSVGPLGLLLPPLHMPLVDSQVSVQVTTERCILETLLAALAQAGSGDQVDVVMFYLADRRVIRALIAAHRRGAALRVILDPNKDAFGWSKDGIPNRPVAEELHRLGIPLRWYDTHGEQCHTKMTMVRYASAEAMLTIGSANYTRRNLENFNLETNVVVRGPISAAALRDALGYVDSIWNNTDGRHCTVEYRHYGEKSVLKYWRYWLMEATGISTF